LTFYLLADKFLLDSGSYLLVDRDDVVWRFARRSKPPRTTRGNVMGTDGHVLVFAFASLYDAVSQFPIGEE
jgi:hypothetical protein